MSVPTVAEISRLSREIALVCDTTGQILWVDPRSRGLVPVSAGGRLDELVVAGNAGKALELVRRGSREAVHNWELTIPAPSTPRAVSFAAAPCEDGVLIVGQILSDDYHGAMAHVQASMDEVVGLNREIARQKHELERYALALTRTNEELQESNRGVLSLHRELEERADALNHSAQIKSRVVSSVSHEFRTPLHSILGLTQLLIDGSDGELNDEQLKQVRFIRSSTDELMTLVNDLLDLSTIESGRLSLRTSVFSVHDFATSLRGALRPLVPADGPVSLEFVFPDDDFTLDTDRAKLSQIVRNLVSNAVKFTERGHVRVIVTGLDDGQVRVSVTDTGIGIPRDAIDHIFEEFTRLDNELQERVKGTGLGLPISKRLAEGLGGDITVESTVGEGSTFAVTIPRVHPDVLEMQNIERRGADRDPSKQAVLVVEDDRRTMFVYERYLSMAGFQVVPARTIDAARAALEHELPSAIVLDVMLEDETSWEFLAEVKRTPRTQHVPVLVCTVTGKAEQARALGADEFWLKPIDQSRLLTKLRSLTRAPRPVRVLVIDDDERARYLFRKHMEGLPYELHEASTGPQGVEMAKSTLPQAIFLDFLLEDMTAFDVLDELKSDPQTRSIPVIIVTAHVLDATARQRLAQGTEAVISKENLSRELAINRIRDALRKGGMEARP